MKFGISEDILNRILDEVKKRENIKKIIHLGHKYEEKYNSDIDIAIYADAVATTDLVLNLDEACEIYRIDITDIKNLSNNQLKEKIEKEGIVI